jgi:hypothetical protein
LHLGLGPTGKEGQGRGKKPDQDRQPGVNRQDLASANK